MTLELIPMSPALGVEVRGVDLRVGLGVEDLASLRDAYDRHFFLLFRGQDLTVEQQQDVVGRFGPLLDERGDGVRHSFISNADPRGILREGELLFHSDLAFTDEPVLGISLYAVDVPPGAAPTRYANALLAYQTLPDELACRLSGLHVQHAYDLAHQVNNVSARVEDLGADAVRAVHPLVMTHPRTGDRILYVGEMQSERILELDEGSSRSLLDELCAHLYQPEHLHSHVWQEGDLVLWDNLALQHARGPVSDAIPRTLRRVALATRRIRDLVPALASMYP